VEEFNPFKASSGSWISFKKKKKNWIPHGTIQDPGFRVLGTSVTGPKVYWWDDGILPFLHMSINMEPAAQQSSPSISPIATASPFILTKLNGPGFIFGTEAACTNAA
jgi:hypothetical protein